MLVDGCANYGNKAFRLGDGARIETPEYDSASSRRRRGLVVEPEASQ